MKVATFRAFKATKLLCSGVKYLQVGATVISSLKSFLNHLYSFWALLSLPAIPVIAGLASGNPETVDAILYPSGEFAARFMILSMMITPLMMLFKGWRGPRWLMMRRRYIGSRRSCRGP
ncbi:hypothetical protein [Falsihalocynthiibacter arcticus]|uniref:Uncharacterized protein n=1 Tax=Falsihalocynthiibacter arcticus TaxID=1579316 RepID=A0A126V220_9RHOB|nr:hypothetical protein [Falsihalocynthiibacter arcticus]AML51995.1 hypothetical protein RC74_12585 [Falsihalocynthiibacter arcticus]